ncbi:putative anaphase-promoting complex subunit 4 [Rosa chinensis]|uniref:Putative anaphase-promoting complex subunit 4 n=1 Tax=Rosa chinensis TaxID=74649 RepID=A0A2P6Q3M0_ROSCH|nr:putative anaphase-promoting complex subunit 4 [Rosa chinensis]
METDEEEQRVTPFQLQFDKPVASQVKIAEWNPEKDLLAMRLWTISPGKSITSLCWRPDGKAVAVSLHDVEFSNFFNWLLKCIKLLNSEPSDHHLLLYNRSVPSIHVFNLVISIYSLTHTCQFGSELVVIFLTFLYDQDPVKQLLEVSEADESIEVGLETVQRVRELVQFGGVSDCEHLQRTLAKEFQQMESSVNESQIVLLLNETTTTSESSGDACMMIVQANDLPYVSITRSSSLNYWNLHQLKDSVVHLQMKNEKVRSIPHSVIAPLAVSCKSL